MYANVGSPGRFSAMTMPRRPRLTCARCLHGVRAAAATDERDRPAQRAARSAASHSCRLDAGDRPDIDEPLVRSRSTTAGSCPSGRTGIRGRPLGETTEQRRSRRRARSATAPTLIASGAVAGDPAVPRPKKSRSFPAEMIGTTPARTTFATASMRHVRPRVGLRAAAREVDDVHPVAHGGLERSDDLGRVRRAAPTERVAGR